MKCYCIRPAVKIKGQKFINAYSKVLYCLHFFRYSVKQYQPYGHCKLSQGHWCEDEQRKQLAHNCIVATNNDAGTQNMVIDFRLTVHNFLQAIICVKLK
jgi:hypothetical protein